MTSSDDTKWLDRLETHLNACSLETYNPRDGNCIPLVIGCYELDTNNHNTDASRRNGQLLLHSIDLEDLKFNLQQTIDAESGVLDGKWFRHPNKTTTEELPLYATANASGSINFYQLITNKENDNNNTFHLKHINASQAVTEDGLALSLCWDESSTVVATSSSNQTKRVVSSYSKGSLAVHTISDNTKNIQEVHRWKGHSLFGCDSEVWTCCFASNDKSECTERILSGGDDCQLKLWDLRLIDNDSTNNTAVSTNRDFDAGVTAVAYHPSKEHMFAVGSYDEQVRLFDIRKMAEPVKTIEVGGGVWRIKWQPSTETMLVAAMHGGCRIVDAMNGDDDNGDDCMTIRKEFVEHESMAYGADWVTKNVAASCSFYDRQVFLWNSCE